MKRENIVKGVEINSQILSMEATLAYWEDAKSFHSKSVKINTINRDNGYEICIGVTFAPNGDLFLPFESIKSLVIAGTKKQIADLEKQLSEL